MTAAEIDLSTLPPELRAFIEAERTSRAVLEGQKTALQEQLASLAEQNRRLEHLVKEFRQALHGRKSEKLSADARQLAFEDLEAAVAEAEAPRSASGSPRRPARAQESRRNLGRLPRELPRIEQIVEPASILCPCGCGEMTRIGEERTERLDIVPAQFRVIVTVRPKYACRRCSGTMPSRI